MPRCENRRCENRSCETRCYYDWNVDGRRTRYYEIDGRNENDYETGSFHPHLLVILMILMILILLLLHRAAAAAGAERHSVPFLSSSSPSSLR